MRWRKQSTARRRCFNSKFTFLLFSVNFSTFQLFLGGLMMLPQKHKAPTKFLYNGGFFITTNEYPDFGNEVDCEAIKKRLDIFETKPLLHKDNSVSGK